MMKGLNLKFKLVCIFLGAGLIPLSGISLYSYSKARTALETSAYEKLIAVQTVKKSSIERYFNSIKNQVITLSSSNMVIDSMSEFKKDFRKFRDDNKISGKEIEQMKRSLGSFYANEFGAKYNKENENGVNAISLLNQLPRDAIALQYYYISKNIHPLGSKNLLNRSNDRSEYSKEHAKVHPVLAQFLDKFGYYDIFFVDSESGNIVYSVFKELDFGTSLINGPYAASNFGEVFRKANMLVGEESVAFTDYQKYTPSFESPASFIASPIFKNGKRIGVLIFQMPIDIVNAIMGEKSGMGETGESYLVGSDGLMRSNALLSKDHTVVNSFKFPEKGKISSKVFDETLKGNAGSMLSDNYMGVLSLSSYTPIKILGKKWSIISEISEHEAFESINELKKWMLIISGAVAGLILVIGVFMGKQIATPILLIATRLDSYSSEVEDASIDISSSSESLSQTTTEQSSAIEETVSSMEEMSAMLDQTSSNADDCLEMSKNSQQEAEKGRDVVIKMVDAMNDIQSSNTRLESIVKAIGEIKQKTEVINDIVSETRLLSFNASIEAARAGIHGKGFAVVAEEVGNLATMSGKAAEEIKLLLDSSTAEVKEVVLETKEKVEVGKNISQDCQSVFEIMSESLNKIVDSIQSINSASKEQKAGVEQTNIAMNEMEQITHQNTANSNQLANKSSILKNGAVELKSAISELKVIILGAKTDQINARPIMDIRKEVMLANQALPKGGDNLMELDFSKQPSLAPDIPTKSRWSSEA